MGLMTPKHASRFDSIRKAFRQAGFNLFYHDLDAQEFGVPQLRRRLFLVGLNKKTFPNTEFIFPAGHVRKVTVRDTIAGLPEPVYFERGLKPTDIAYHPNHWTMMPKSKKFQTKTSTDGRSFRRLEWDKVSPTVAYGNREIHVHPDGGRRLSVHEAMLLQGFPPTYRLTGNFSQQITQVSNAVPPPVAQVLAACRPTRDPERGAVMTEEEKLDREVRQNLDTGKVTETTLVTDERVIARITDGIYRQPASALRELIANAYDADATNVYIETDWPKFSRISIRDDGNGMTIETLARLIKHIGGSSKRTTEGTENGVASEQDSA